MARSPELLVTSDARSPKKTLASTVPRGPAEDVGFFGARGRRPAQHLERRIDHQPAGHHHGCHDIRHRRAPGARTHGPTGGMEHWPNRPRPSKDLEYLPPLIHSSNLGLLDPNCFLLLVQWMCPGCAQKPVGPCKGGLLPNVSGSNLRKGSIQPVWSH